MFIGYITVRIYIPQSNSLKEKRQIVEGLKQRIRNKFNVAFSEKPSDKWQHCELSFVCTHYDRANTVSLLDHLEEYMRFHNDIYILELEKQII